MKGKDIITYAVRSEMPDMGQLRESCVRKAHAEGGRSKNASRKRFAIAVSCIAAAFAIAIAFQHFNSAKIIPPATPIDSAVVGLPVENFSLANVEDSAMLMDRIGFTDFASMFEWGVDGFVVVKIDKAKTIYGDRQLNNAIVLESVYGNIEAKAVQITQYIYINHFCIGTTNLLREGGAYLLPLKQSEGGWYVVGDLDLLFEIDDSGKVWSHSEFDEFKSYDGKAIESLIDDVRKMAADEDFILVNSPFSRILRGWALADIEILDKSNIKTDNNGYKYIDYSIKLNEILSTPENSQLPPLRETGDIKVYIDEIDQFKLLPGSRYLMCLDRDGDDIYLNPRMIAKVNDNGTITAMPAADEKSNIGASIFTPYDGENISSIRDMVSRITMLRSEH